MTPSAGACGRSIICDAVRTPFGRYGGALAAVRTDDLAALPMRGAAGAQSAASTGRRWTMSSSAAPIRRARTIATSRAWRCCWRACRRPCRAPRSIGCAARAWTPSHRGPRDPGRRARTGDRRRRREHVARAVRHGQGRSALSRAAPKLEDTTLGWRFINPQMKAPTAGLDGARPARTSPRSSTFPRRSGCVRLSQPAALRDARWRTAFSRRRSRRSRSRRRKGDAVMSTGRASAAGYDAGRRWRAEAESCSRTAPSPPAMPPVSTTARRRCCSLSEAAAKRHGLTPRARVLAGRRRASRRGSWE